VHPTPLCSHIAVMGCAPSTLVPQTGTRPIVAAESVLIEQSKLESLVATYSDSETGKTVLTHTRDSWPIVHPGGMDQSHAVNKASKWGPVKERSVVDFTDAKGRTCGILINGESKGTVWAGELQGARITDGGFIQKASGYENGDGIGVLCVLDPAVEAVVVTVETVGADALAIGTVATISQDHAAGAVKVPPGLTAIGIIKPVLSLADSLRRGYKAPIVGGLGFYAVGADGLVAETPSLVMDGSVVKNEHKERVASCPGGSIGAFAKRKQMQVAPGADALKVVALATEWDANMAGFEKDSMILGGGGGAGALG